MPRKRIHELAKEWGMDTRYLLSKLEELGVQGKRAQSTLTDEEITLVRPGAAIPDTSALVLGEGKIVGERVVTELDQQNEQVVTAREEIRESRISQGVIRRRAKRVEVLHEDDSSAPPVPASELPSLPTLDSPFAAPPPLPLAFEIPEVEPAPSIPVASLPEHSDAAPLSQSAAAQSQTKTPDVSLPETDSVRSSVPVEVREATVPVKKEPLVNRQDTQTSNPPVPPLSTRATPLPSSERPPVVQRSPVSPSGTMASPARVSLGVNAGTATSPALKE